MAKGFSLGAVVSWTSQAGSYSKSKSGEVAEVVTAGCRPSRERFPSFYRSVGCGLPREHESYVVMVGNRPYWPRVSKLALDTKARRKADEAVDNTRNESNLAGSLHALLVKWEQRAATPKRGDQDEGYATTVCAEELTEVLIAHGLCYREP